MEKRCPYCLQIVTGKKSCSHCGQPLNHTNPLGCLKVNDVLADRYQIGKLLEQNSASKVYKSYDLAANKTVLLRECTGVLENVETGGYMPNPRQLVERFIKFGRAMAEINLCNPLPRTIDVFETDGKGYIVSEYFEGKSLKDLLNSQVNITENNAKKIVSELCVAVKAMGAIGICFGGICPANIYILKNGDVKLYGIGSGVYDEIEDIRLRMQLLNPSYAAPELFQNGSFVGAYTDVYSLAALLYRLLCHEIPPISYFRESGESLKKPKKLNANIQNGENNAILNALNTKIEDRTQTVTAFIKQLKAKNVVRVWSFTTIKAAALGLVLQIKQKVSSVKATDDHSNAVQSEKALNRAKKGQPKKSKKTAIMIALISLLALVFIGLAIYFGISLTHKNKTADNTSSGFYYGEKDQKQTLNFIDTSSDSTKKKTEKESSSAATESIDESLLTVCPNLVGLTIEQANEALSQSELKLGNVTREFSDTEMEGTVLSQKIESGTKVEKGKSIGITVSKGANTAPKMPNLVGDRLEDAVAKLEKSGIKYNIVYKNLGQKAGTVLIQSVEPFERVSDLVTLTVSGKKITTPNYCGKSPIEAVKDGLFTINKITDAAGNTYSAYDSTLIITEQSIAAGETTYKGNTINFTVKK